nr:DUF4030 domain-containing protein [Heyndrickxia oleronia]
MNDPLFNYVKKEMDEIRIPEDKLDFAIENAIKRGRKKWKLGKKIVYFSGAAIILCCLFISSAFVSPAMAKVVSKVPYLGQIFESKDVITVIDEKLREKGYNISSIGIGYQPKKTIEVSLKGEDYFNEVKDDIKKIIMATLKSKGYDAYLVRVNKMVPKNDYVLNKKEIEEKSTLENEVIKKLKHLDYTFNMVQVDPVEKKIFINIEGSEKYFKSIQDSVEKTALEVANANKYKGYRISAMRTTVKVTKVDKGAQIIPTIAEGLMSKKEYKVTGVSYKSKPLTFIIRTSILSSDPTAKTLGTEIETIIVEFLASKKISSILDNESYEIIVNGKDNEKIN